MSFFAGVVVGGGGSVQWQALRYVHATVGLGAFGHALLLGLATFARVVVLVVVATWSGCRSGCGSA